MSPSLRPLTPDNAQAVAELFTDYESFHNGTTDVTSADDILDWWRRTDGGAAGVFDEDDRLLGAGTLRRRGTYYIADHFVHPDARGRGVATALLDWGEQQAGDAEEGRAWAAGGFSGDGGASCGCFNRWVIVRLCLAGL